MKILFTGASSLTGFWFVQDLISRGHDVTTLFRQPKEKYQGVRRARVEKIWFLTDPIVASFGDDKFFEEIEHRAPWDLFCHHAADATNYKSEDFEIGEAIYRNTLRAKKVLETLKTPLLYTGSVFEGEEGVSDHEPLRPFSPYGLSKQLTASIFNFWAERQQIPMAKFVIPNPFGPYEDFRYTSYLIDQWFQGQTPLVRTPEYIRDNIHVSLLACAYGDTAEKLVEERSSFSVYPSGYCGKQGDFTSHFAAAMAPRLKINCPYILCEQKEFHEPKMRVNTTPYAVVAGTRWDEEKAWDELAQYYLTEYSTKK